MESERLVAYSLAPPHDSSPAGETELGVPAAPRTVRSFVSSLRLPRCRRPGSEPISKADLNRASSDPSSDHTARALRILEEEEARTGLPAKIRLVRTMNLLPRLRAAFEAIPELPTVAETEPVAEEEKGVLAKLALCYADMWAAVLDDPRSPQHTPSKGFARLLNIIFRHYGSDCEAIALGVQPRLAISRVSATLGQASTRGEPSQETVFAVEVAPVETTSGESGKEVLREQLDNFSWAKSLVVQRSQSGDRLVWSREYGKRGVAEFKTQNSLHWALLQVSQLAAPARHKLRLVRHT